ncbi:unnamed protein product [Cylindrotheca closterium]|uniref:mRNA-decapping enzyme C-terminal domain-containing protein n=1 Tax=Cylindrotheca closterium TaxID=2856 RepID=A0AAD2PVP7_9STRA|nr:unnamed protein product [Cylindrotheca closterium]
MALNINEQARKEANLRLLQRTTDPTISNILDSATHVVLYKFAPASQSWEKSNVEGGLFLAVKQSGYMMVILNRNSPDNYSIQLSANFQLQHQDPYLIFRQVEQGETVIRGIWFPNANERLTVNESLSQVLERLRSQPPAPTRTPVNTPAHKIHPSAAAGLDQGAALTALLTPLSLDTAGGATPVRSNQQHYAAITTPTQQQPQPSQVLDKKSLQLALLSLVQDDRFLDLLHAQYLKVAHARASRGNNGN